MDRIASVDRLVLASTSPSRLMVLRGAGVEPEIVPPEVDEEAVLASLPADVGPAAVGVLALEKARAVAAGVEGTAIVVGGDSMLLLDGKLQGKPHTVEATVERWRAQRGRVAHLLTGQAVLAVADGEIVAEHADVADNAVHFAAASDADIEAYARSGEPLECAGAFTLESLGGWFIDRIEGDPSAVIGLSLPLLRRRLAEWGVDAHVLWNR